MTRRAVARWMQQAQSYLYERDVAAAATKRKNAAREFLYDYILDHGTETGDRHRQVDFPEPVTVGDAKYAGLELRRKVTPMLRTDDAYDLLKARGLLDRVIEVVPAHERYNWEELYVLVQEGLLTEEEIDGLQDEDIVWALHVREA